MAHAVAAIVERGPQQCAALRRRRGAAPRLAAARLAWRCRPSLSRPVAEAAALEAPLRQPGQSRPHRPGVGPRRRVSLCQRRRGLCRLDAPPLARAGRTSTGRRSGPTTGAGPFPSGRGHATRPRRSRPAENRPISRSSVCERRYKSFTRHQIRRIHDFTSRVYPAMPDDFPESQIRLQGARLPCRAAYGRIDPDRGDRRDARASRGSSSSTSFST